MQDFYETISVASEVFDCIFFANLKLAFDFNIL